MVIAAKNFIKSHKRLLKLMNIILGNNYKPKIVTFREIVDETEKWCRNLPSDYDCIIGIPKAGLIVSSIVASKFQLPLSTFENFVNGNIWISKDVVKPESINRILIINNRGLCQIWKTNVEYKTEIVKF